MRTQIILAGVVLAAGTLTASAASVDKEINVKAPADKVWAMIGPFCSIAKWHPAIGTCTEDNGVRTLTTKDGKGTFVEKQTKNDPKDMKYSYEIEKSPLPITGYNSMIKVTPEGADKSKVEWSSTYTPDSGKADAAKSALEGIYQSGLDNIKKMAGS